MLCSAYELFRYGSDLLRIYFEVNFVLTLVLPSIIYLALGVMVNKLRIGSNDGKKNHLYICVRVDRPREIYHSQIIATERWDWLWPPVFLRDLP